MRADFAVVGGGIAGASVAFELAAHGTVVLVEQEPTLGYHTTGRSAALYTEAYETGPVRLLVLDSRRMLESPPEGFSDSPLLAPLPVLFVARSDQRASLDAFESDVAGVVPTSRLNATEVRSACPVIKRGHIVGGLLEPGSMEIDVHALHQGFLGGARRRGARIFTGMRATAIAVRPAGVVLETGSEPIHAGLIVNAAGAWCDTVGVMAGAAPKGLQPFRRTAFTFAAPQGVQVSGWPMVVDVDEDFYFKPEGSQVMGSLAEETPMEPHDVQAEEADVALGIDRINEATTMNVTHIRRTWAGLRTFSPDRRPVVGYDPDVRGLFWLGGQGGYGIMTSPAMGRLAAGLIVHGKVPDSLDRLGFDPAAADPARFAA